MQPTACSCRGGTPGFGLLSERSLKANPHVLCCTPGTWGNSIVSLSFALDAAWASIYIDKITTYVICLPAISGWQERLIAASLPISLKSLHKFDQKGNCTFYSDKPEEAGYLRLARKTHCHKCGMPISVQSVSWWLWVVWSTHLRDLDMLITLYNMHRFD